MNLSKSGTMKLFLISTFILISTACTTDDNENPRTIDGKKYVNIYQVDGKDVGEMVYTTAVSGKDYRAKSVYFVNHNKDVSIIYTDLADKYSNNTDFVGIQASLYLN